MNCGHHHVLRQEIMSCLTGLKGIIKPTLLKERITKDQYFLFLVFIG